MPTPLARSGVPLSPLGFGAFKIGRNAGIKYPQGYALPDEPAVSQLLNGILDLGCTLIDTAPAYGLSEERIGRAIAHRRDEYLLSTKVGETFADGHSTYDFSRGGIEQSLTRSLQRLQTDSLDLVLIHSPGDDRYVLEQTDVVAVLHEWKARGAVRAIGLSGKTPEGAQLALAWADVVMVEYHQQDASHAAVIAEAGERGVTVLIKKGLASGKLSADAAIRFVLAQSAVQSLVVGGLNLDHFQTNWATAQACRTVQPG
jgi:aryl-alcohol dehydrogenase-like predicted oxidoreductase